MKKKRDRPVNTKRFVFSLVCVLIISTVTVFAIGAPELFGEVSPLSASTKQCDCDCDCSYCLSGECTFKRG